MLNWKSSWFFYTVDTHYVEIGISKDKKFFIHTDGNGSATVIDRTKTPRNDDQIMLVEGGESKRVFVDHIRVIILLSNLSVGLLFNNRTIK